MAWPRSRSSAPADVAEPDPEATADDATLVAAAQTAPQAFTRLYERYVGPIYQYCYLRLGSREAAEDATSEAFLKALSALGRYRDGAFAAWLFRIARNVTIDIHRRRRPSAPLAAAGNMPDPARTPEDAAIARSEQ